jgi:Family of unknown function (DUF6252)
MKKATILLSLVALTFGWVACKKKEKVTPPVQIDTVVYMPGVHATVNGAPWNNYNVDNTSVTGGGHYNFEYGGTDTNFVKVSIYIDDATGTGVHNLSTTSADKAYYMMDTGTAPVKVYATSGQINITSLNDSNVQGTFNFTAGSNTVTNGTFNMKF